MGGTRQPTRGVGRTERRVVEGGPSPIHVFNITRTGVRVYRYFYHSSKWPETLLSGLSVARWPIQVTQSHGQLSGWPLVCAKGWVSLQSPGLPPTPP